MAQFLIHFQPEEENYLRILKPLVTGKARVKLNNIVPTVVMELAITAKQNGLTQIATSSVKLAKMLVGWDDKAQREQFSHTDYSGSFFKKHGCEFLILPPLEHLATVPHGKHIFERYLKKFISPDAWIELPDFEAQWEIYMPHRRQALLETCRNATFVSCDIETHVDGDRTISCLGFTAVSIDSQSKNFTTDTCVIPFDSMHNIKFAREVLATGAPKVFQNGKYDIAYLLRYGMPPINYAFDTINLFHCWFSELPKDLGFITQYLLREWVFHKNENSGDLYEHYRYNAKDAFSTAMSLLAILNELPQYAINNYLLEFPVVFPCILSEAQGIKCDVNTLKLLRSHTEQVFSGELAKLQKMTAVSTFNPGSPKQVGELFAILGCGDLKGTGKIAMDKAASRHPINKKILTRIKKYREDRKLYGTYLDENKLWNGRIYYAINPHGTDTGRLASRESQFWCGLQIQNIPRDRKDIQIKSAFIADNGFMLGEADLEQAEARDTAYLSGDLRLITAVDDITKDYHGTNASAFFGIPYEKIVLSTQNEVTEKWHHETIDKAIRDLAKRTNHGANYNMGAGVMVDTMGIENVLRAKKLLGLPNNWTLLKVCEFLLKKFSDTYSTVKGAWYDKCIADVQNTRLLVGPTGWTRYCFGSPGKSKRDLNRYVAHPPQSLNAMVLNQAYRKVFYEIWMKWPSDFRLCAQIHDSILFQYRVGRVDLAHAVKKAMEIPIVVRDTFGIERTLLVPAALKGEATRWSELKEIAD